MLQQAIDHAVLAGFSGLYSFAVLLLKFRTPQRPQLDSEAQVLKFSSPQGNPKV